MADKKDDRREEEGMQCKYSIVGQAKVSLPFSSISHSKKIC